MAQVSHLCQIANFAVPGSSTPLPVTARHLGSEPLHVANDHAVSLCLCLSLSATQKRNRERRTEP